MVGIEHCDDRTLRSIGINLTGGHVNAVEICTRVLAAPTFDTLLKDYLQLKGVASDIAETQWVDANAGEELVEEDDEDEEVY